MKLVQGEYDDAYKRLQTLSFQCGVLVFASARECDALCATKILTSMLRLDSIPFSVVPVADAEQLMTQAKVHLGADEGDEAEPRAIILLNCGGTDPVLKVRSC